MEQKITTEHNQIAGFQQMKVIFGLLYKYKTNRQQEAENSMWNVWQPVIELFKFCILKAGTA